MQIPFSLTVLGLERDPMQSLSTFYNVVKKLEHFEDEIFDHWCHFSPNQTVADHICEIFRLQNALTF